MIEKKALYITTTLPYVNAKPHIGFALEAIQADSFARYKRLAGYDVFFNTGSDEHGQKLFEAAQKAGRDVREYVDHYASEFEELKSALDLSYDSFVRTTNPDHQRAVQEIWRRCQAKGDIYEKEFEGLYCIGCERFLTQKDIVDGKCSIHLKEPQLLKEKNWFFRLSKYRDEILKYLKNSQTIIPDWRREEAINFVKEGLEDFSISRERSRLSWGIPVPGDEGQVMYVWFDALTGYISALGWPNEEGDFKKFWLKGDILQMAGKDQVRFQSIMWQGMLFSAGLKNTDRVFYHGFINSGGQKMSKSLGNVINPYDLVKKYGTDASRYLLLRHVHTTEDTDVTWERLDEWYNAHLANGLGNLVSRIMTLSEKNVSKPVSIPEWKNLEEYSSLFEDLDFNGALEYVWEKIGSLDAFIQEKKPWETKDTEIISELVRRLYTIARLLNPIMPSTSGTIKELIKKNIKPEAPLFQRLTTTN